MKIISLNTWGGKLFESLAEFIKRMSVDTDIFCLQEVFRTLTTLREKDGVRINLLADLSEILPNFDCYFALKSAGYDYEGDVDFDLGFGIGIFCKKNIKVEHRGDFFDANYHNLNVGEPKAGKAQFVAFKIGDIKLTVCNFHGMWFKGEKNDNELRIEQSYRIREFLEKVDGEKILCGDFNLLPNTKSMEILEDGMINLIKTYGITSTRSHYYTKDNKFADYILVSPGVKVKSFKVLSDIVSDHLPLSLEII